MNKKRLHHTLAILGRLSYAWLFGLGLFFAVTALFALRQNNQKMIQLKQSVFSADEKNGDVEGALRNLRVFVYSHMNTNLASGSNAVRPPIQLKYHYERLVAAEKARLADPTALPRPISEDLYKFDFVSPRWSPDLAGWSLVAMSALFVVAAIRYASERAILSRLHKNA